LLFFYYLFGWV